MASAKKQFHNLFRSMRSYRAYAPHILLYQSLSLLLLFLIVYGFRYLMYALIYATGHAAVTSGDFIFFFRHWAGYAVLILFLILIFFVVSTSVNGQIILCARMLRSEKVSFTGAITEGIRSTSLFFNLSGIPTILYVTVVSAALLTTLLFNFHGFFEPASFIYYQLEKSILFQVLYGVFLLLLLLPAFRGIFLIPCVILEKKPVPEAKSLTRRIRQEARSSYFPALYFCIAGALIAVLLTGFLFDRLPGLLRFTIFLPRIIGRFVIVAVLYVGIGIVAMSILLLIPFLITETLRTYFAIRGDELQIAVQDRAPDLKASAKKINCKIRSFAGRICTILHLRPFFARIFALLKLEKIRPACKKVHGALKAFLTRYLIPFFSRLLRGLVSFVSRPGGIPRLVLILYLLAAVLSVAAFDTLFPSSKDISIIVHRLGGDDEVENSLEGQKLLLSRGALAAETDIQRTKDGQYVVFHDPTMRRMCGINARVRDLTLDEIRQIAIRDASGRERKIPTLSEVLDTAKDRQILYIELKGSTADEQMADDIIEMIRSREMEEQCMLISMNYKVISYIHKNYDDIKTGFLYFFAFGNEPLLNCDMLIIQEKSISPQLVRSVHSQGKTIGGWTVNTRKDARRLLSMNLDGIVTDRYDLLTEMQERMANRPDYQRVMDTLRY